MEYKFSEEKNKELKRKNNILIKLCFLMVLCNVLYVLLLKYEWDKKQVVLVPMNLYKSAEIGQSSVSSSYLEQVAIFLSSQRLDVTPKTIHQNTLLILSHTDPRYYSDFKRVLNKEEGTIIEKDISSAFYIRELKVDTSKLIVLMSGDLRRWVGERFIGSSDKTYKMKFSHVGNKILLTSFTEDQGKNEV